MDRNGNAETLEVLIKRWNGFGQSHFDGPEIKALATQIIAATHDAETLGQLPYAVGNWNGSWRQVGKHAAAACEKVAAAALAIDPTNEGALWLYAQEDFLWSVNRSKAKNEKIKGPPVPKATPSDSVQKIQGILKEFEAGTHPLSILSMDPIPVDSPEVVDALIAGIACEEYRGALRCIEALGRATVELPRVLDTFIDVLAKGDHRFIDRVAMAAHYGLKKNGGPLTIPLLATAEKIILDLRPDDTSDYRHQWPLRSAMDMALHADAFAQERMRAYLEQLVTEFPSMPDWKKDRMFEANMDAPKLLVKLRKSLIRPPTGKNVAKKT